MRVAHCRRCNARVMVVESPTGALWTLDVEPNPRGHFWFDANGAVRDVQPAQRTELLAANEEIYISHLATCQHASAQLRALPKRRPVPARRKVGAR